VPNRCDCHDGGDRDGCSGRIRDCEPRVGHKLADAPTRWTDADRGAERVVSSDPGRARRLGVTTRHDSSVQVTIRQPHDATDLQAELLADERDDVGRPAPRAGRPRLHRDL